MNGTFQTNSSYIDSLDLHKKGNLTSDVEATPLQPIISSAIIVIFLASIFGNSIIIHIIRTDNTMKTTTNYLILNQACADLLVTMIELAQVLAPFNNIGYQWFGGPFGLITCRAFLASTFIVHIFSIWMLVTIAVERFFAVVRLLTLSPVSKHLKKTVLLLWTWSVASSTNFIVNGTVAKIGRHNYCYFANELITFYSVLTTAFHFALPLLIITVLYIFVSHKLWSREVPGEGTNQNQGQAEAIKTAKKVTITMIVIVILYVVCFGAINVYGLLVFLSYVEMDHSFYLFLIWLTVAFSGLNPYVYFAFSQKFRNGLKHLFGNCLRKMKIHNALSFRSQRVELEQM